MVKRKYFIFFTLCLLFFVSCSPAYRFNRLVKKHPELITTDTITQIDTMRLEIPKTQVDTVFLTNQLRDTIIIEKERLKVKMYTVHDSIYVDAKCDTVYVEKIVERKIPVKYYEKKVHWFDQVKTWIKWFFIIFFIFLGANLIYKITK